MCERTTLENKLANHNKTTSITRVDIAIMKTPKAGKHAPVCEVFTTSLVSETIISGERSHSGRRKIGFFPFTVKFVLASLTDPQSSERLPLSNSDAKLFDTKCRLVELKANKKHALAFPRYL